MRPSRQLLNAFVECLLECEDLATCPERTAEEEKEYKELLDELGSLLIRILAVSDEKE